MRDADSRLMGQLKQSGLFLFENGRVGSVHQVDLVSHEPAKPSISSSMSKESEKVTIEITRPDFLNSVKVLPVDTRVTLNPLQKLKERIEELKEKMAKILGNENASAKRHQTGKIRYRSLDTSRFGRPYFKYSNRSG